jgi:hypothetical protein
MLNILHTAWRIFITNKEVMLGILGIQILLIIIIIVMLALDEEDPVMRQ